MTGLEPVTTSPQAGGADLRRIPIWRANGWYESLDLADVPGNSGWRLSLAPQVMVAADARSRASQAPRSALGADERMRILEQSLDLFADGEIELGPAGPQSAAAFREAMKSLAGLPFSLTDRWTAMLRGRLTMLAPGSGMIERTLVSLPANTFTCLEAVFEAVLRSEDVWIRPSRREPLSALRFVAALLQAGWPADRLAFYPTEPGVLATLIRVTDRQVVFGGNGVAGRVPDVPRLSLRGPGRGCALVPDGAHPEAAADWLLPLIAADSGRFCKNVCTVLCLDDPEPVAEALAVRMDAICLHPADAIYPQAALPDPAQAPRIADAVLERMSPLDRLATARPLLQRCGAEVFLAPALIRLAEPGTADAPHPLLAYELPFPFASISQADPRLTAAVRQSSLFVYAAPGCTGSEGKAT
jgi:hypothetical protein